MGKRADLRLSCLTGQGIERHADSAAGVALPSCSYSRYVIDPALGLGNWAFDRHPSGDLQIIIVDTPGPSFTETITLTSAISADLADQHAPRGWPAGCLACLLVRQESCHSARQKWRQDDHAALQIRNDAAV
jgi:hypothetical protein